MLMIGAAFPGALLAGAIYSQDENKKIPAITKVEDIVVYLKIPRTLMAKLPKTSRVSLLQAYLVSSTRSLALVDQRCETPGNSS